MKYIPWPYQDFAKEHVRDNPGAGLIMDMGLGKTVIVLTALNELMFDELEVNKVLVIAPKRVAECVWTDEAAKWDHLRHLKFSIVLGTERQRKEALRVKADIYVINRENVMWLIAHYGGAIPFDTVVVDESSSFKNPSSRRFKAIRTVRPKIKRLIILTGTPIPNGMLDLWSQIFLLDRGERLGESFALFRQKYFKPAERNGLIVYNYELQTFKQPQKRNGSYTADELYRKNMNELLGESIFEKEIYDKISDICISMKAADYLDLPKKIDRTVEVRLPDDIFRQYLEFEKKQILALPDDEEITAVNAAGLTNKLLQFANGAVYDADKNYHEVHLAKIEALEEDIEAANGQPLLVAYAYRHDLEQIQKHLKAYNPQVLKNAADVKLWNEKKIPVLLLHPASGGHGLNMQDGGHLLSWFGLTWNLEWYLQLIARLDRQGQKFPVTNSRLVVKGTMDEDVLRALNDKAVGQDALMKAVKARIHKYRKS